MSEAKSGDRSFAYAPHFATVHAANGLLLKVAEHVEGMAALP